MERFVGRVALVTGASAGIGAELSRTLVQQGMKVIGCARNVHAIQELALTLQGEKGSLHAIKCDLTKEQEILAMFQEITDKHGGVDVCVNNAALNRPAAILSGSTDDWRNILDVNVMAMCICTREAVKSMRQRGVDDGHVIQLNSIAGHRCMPRGDMSMLAASKYAVTALTEGVRNELRKIKSNIRVSAVSPGVTHTEFFHRCYGQEEGEKIYGAVKSLNARDVVATIMYVLSAPPHVQVHDVIVQHIGDQF